MANINKKIKRARRPRKKNKRASGAPGASPRTGVLQQAMAFHQAGRLAQAEALYREVLQVDPEHPAALHFLGSIAQETGRNDIAAELMKRVITLKPDFAEAHYILGNALEALGKTSEAIACFRQSVALKPDYVKAHYNMGTLLHKQGKLDEAIASLRKAIILKPDFAEAHYNLGLSLDEQCRPEEAASCYHQALTLKPDFIDAHCNLGFIFRESGKMDDARACFRKALALKPDHARAYKALSSIKKFTEVDEAIRAMEDLYNKKGDLSAADRIDLGFALGKVFEDLGNYDKSFGFILEANVLKRRTNEYSMQEDHDFFKRIKKTFSPDFFASHPGAGSQERTPIFIVGMPRSGTSLVEQIVASHPLVFGACELAVLARLTNSICTGETTAQFPECMSDLGSDAFKRMGSDYIEKMREYSNDAKYITDKMPYNFLRVGLIKTILPNAKVIHCVRNPMDICFSIFKKDFKGIHGYAYDLVELGQYYNLYQDLMAHWEKVLPGFMYTLRYEKMVADQRNQTKSLLDFCDLPWDEACLNFYRTERIVNTASFAQVRQPIYTDSVDLWKRYAKHLEPLKKAIYGESANIHPETRL